MNGIRYFAIILFFTSFLNPTALGSGPQAGSLHGTVFDGESKSPLPYANIMIVGTLLGVSADEYGKYLIPDIAVGSYSVQCSYLGYKPLILADVIIKPGRTTTLDIPMTVTSLEAGEVSIKANCFANVELEPVAAATMSYEELRRHPNSAGDISRIIMALPSVAKVNDVETALIVRGGSTLENAFYVDGVPVPNINHFPSQGASSGAMGLINVDFIEDVKFMPGGFPARFGDKMSSVTEISLREGNRHEFTGQLDMSMAGAGGGVEGPLAGGKGSWMFSAHRSYFDLLIDLFEVEASTTPFYTDFQTKVSYDLSNRHKLTMLDIAGFDVSRIDREKAIENKEGYYGRGNWDVNTFGLGWQCLWGSHGYSQTTFSHNITAWDSKWSKTTTDMVESSEYTTEQQFVLRSDHHLLLGIRSALDLGVDAVLQDAELGNFWASNLDLLGNQIPAINVSRDIQAGSFGGHASLRKEWLPRFITNTGVRADYSDLTNRGTISPRVQLSYIMDERTTLNAAYGRYYQRLPLVVLSQNDKFKDLKDPLADHYILGFSRLLSMNTRLTCEAYAKEYSRMPLDPDQPPFFVIDQFAKSGGGHTRLVDSGKAWTRGVEVMVQKKLVERLFGVVSGSIFRTRYKGYDEIWRDRSYDNRWMFTIEGGYKPSRSWEYSVRWVYAGGAPYTPFYQTASLAAGEGIRDANRVNKERLPDYHSLNLRVDRRFHFHSSDVICYLNIWNVYNRKNIAEYTWSIVENRQRTSYQWGILPVIGIEYEF
ncbi:TonB-dependent receptor [bacterium]|nr:TonB-dependent receptor [bacterium]